MPVVTEQVAPESKATANDRLLMATRAEIDNLMPLALASLRQMYRPEDRLFAFRVKPTATGLRREGLSRRYTAITLIGLADQPSSAAATVLGGHPLSEVCARLVADAPRMENLGDVALALWAVRACRAAGVEALEERLAALDPFLAPHPTVEVAWALAAMCVTGDATANAARANLADRLVKVLHPVSRLFPHVLGDVRSRRSHVSCYADLVYPIHALSLYSAVSGERLALDAAVKCAEQMCARQGQDGQWWWHHDYRTGHVVERYPVYAIHQDAMGPMALLALRWAGGPDFTASIARGLRWLKAAPELAGGSLVDEPRGVIWRKVARREPAKLSRYLNAAASGVHPSLRVPALDALFPAGAIDFEDRPYHIGWMLYAWGPQLAGSAVERTRA